MTSIVRKQWTMLCGIALVGGALLCTGGKLWAQDEPAKLTRDEAAKEFALVMTDQRFAYTTLNRIDFGSLISRKSIAELENQHVEELLLSLAAQWSQPDQTVKVQSEGDKTSTVTVESAPRTAPRPIVLVEEDGGWGVDLVETYAVWNHLEGAAKAKEIYRITGVALEGFPRDPGYGQKECLSNLKQMDLGLLQYCQDWDERFPPAKTWKEAIRPYLKNEKLFDCPALAKGQHNGYAFNSKLSTKSQASLKNTANIVAIYETSVLKNDVTGTGENLALRHEDGTHYAFADGHVQSYPRTFKANFNLGR